MTPPADKPPSIPCPRASEACGATWLFSVMLAVCGLICLFTMHRMSVALPMIALGASTVGMVVFLSLYGRACRLEAAKVVKPQQPVVDAPPVVVSAGYDDAMRRLFDRFDPLAIERARGAGLAPTAIAGFLPFARDFVDTAHAVRLLDAHDEAELERHLKAGIERALVTYQSG